jgi:hypothetical protein
MALDGQAIVENHAELGAARVADDAGGLRHRQPSAGSQPNLTQTGQRPGAAPAFTPPGATWKGLHAPQTGPLGRVTAAPTTIGFLHRPHAIGSIVSQDGTVTIRLGSSGSRIWRCECTPPSVVKCSGTISALSLRSGISIKIPLIPP